MTYSCRVPAMQTRAAKQPFQATPLRRATLPSRGSLCGELAVHIGWCEV